MTTPTVGHNSGIGSVAADQFRSLVTRVERLTEDKDAILSDIRDVYAEAKNQGFDVKVMREVVRRRRMEKNDRDEHDEILALYEGVFG